MRKSVAGVAVSLLCVGLFMGTQQVYAGSGEAGQNRDLKEDVGLNSVSGNDAIGLYQQNDIISLIVPNSIDFVLDPYEIGGSQIYSDVYSFCNTGEQAVCVEFTSVTCALAKDVQPAASAKSIEEVKDNTDREIFLQLCFGDGTTLAVGQNTGGYRMVLASGEAGTLSVGGYLSSGAPDEWESGDAKITIVYSVSTIEEKNF